MRRALLVGVWLGVAVGCTGSTSGDRPEVATRQESMRVDRTTLAGDNAFAAIEPVWSSVDIYNGPASYEESSAPFTPEQRYISAIHWYRSEVNNGGHDQFYYNSTGIVWRDALAGFELLGLDEFASVLRESAVRLGGEPPLDREERDEVLQRLEPQFGDLDDRFYTLQETIDLDGRMMDFMRRNAGAFEFDGVVEIPVLAHQ